MIGLGPTLIVLVVLSAYAFLGAAALSVGQAWAEPADGLKPVRYVVAWLICTAVLALPVFIALGFPAEFATAHTNVGWTAIPLSALTTAAAFGYVRRLWLSGTHNLGFVGSVTRLIPIHVALLVILGAVDLLILGVIFLGNIH